MHESPWVQSTSVRKERKEGGRREGKEAREERNFLKRKEGG
jgi:hypothetical protein